jgi:hypothetical protein
MALWKHDNNHEIYDDGATTQPGEDGFTRELAEKHFGDKDFSYMGTPNWAPPLAEEPPEPSGLLVPDGQGGYAPAGSV